MISFVIPAHNEEALIGRTVQSIHEAVGETGRAYEIIVSNDASTDRTAEIAIASGAQVVNVDHRQISRVRNSGAAMAKGDILVFVDADTILLQNTLLAALETLNHGAVGGGCRVSFDGDIPLWATGILHVMTFLFRVFRWAAGCFIFCRREAFEAVGGFNDEIFAGEELFMSQALKTQGRFVILREAVITSGRKLRCYSGFEILMVFIRISLKGPGGARQRKGLEIWYESPREELAGELKKTTATPISASGGD